MSQRLTLQKCEAFAAKCVSFELTSTVVSSDKSAEEGVSFHYNCQ